MGLGDQWLQRSVEHPSNNLKRGKEDGPIEGRKVQERTPKVEVVIQWQHD